MKSTDKLENLPKRAYVIDHIEVKDTYGGTINLLHWSPLIVDDDSDSDSVLVQIDAGILSAMRKCMYKIPRASFIELPFDFDVIDEAGIEKLVNNAITYRGLGSRDEILNFVSQHVNLNGPFRDVYIRVIDAVLSSATV